mgnify:FL=1
MAKIKIFALGGLNEIGKNMYIVDIDNSIFVFDAGLKYADDKMLGVDYIIPKYDYLIQNKKRIKGIFITHGHDEQMGALPDILPELDNIPVYATKFTMEIIKRELEESKINYSKLIEIKPHVKLNFGKVSIFPINLTHSVPDSVGYVINTVDGAIFYTGNFMFDSSMLGPYKTDIGKLAYIGKQGVLCLLSESMYADKKGFTAPNNRIAPVVNEILDQDDRILISVFPNQFYKIQELFNGIMHTDRNVVIIGKRLQDIILNSIELKYMKFDVNRIKTISHVNDKNIIVFIADDREKPFSNFLRIIKGYDKFIKLNKKDTVLFMSPVFPGMEKSSSKLLDGIAKIGCNLIELSSKYLSHHASSEDLMLMINLLNPKYYMPVNGEYRHEVANKKAAIVAGMNEENILCKLNGEVVYFKNGKLVNDNIKIPTDELLIDGEVGDVGEIVLKDREMLSDNGVVVAVVTIDKSTKKLRHQVEIHSRGFVYVRDNIDVMKEAVNIVTKVVNDNTKPNFIDYNKVKLGIRDELGKYFYNEIGTKPMILLIVQEI